MLLILRTRLALLASAVALPLSSAHAVERNLFTWSGTVDREVTIEVRGRDIQTHGSGLDASFAPRLDVNSPLPRIEGTIRARLDNGRGVVQVLENPSERNNYTARLRVIDDRPGADRYRVEVWFEPNIGRYDDPRTDPRNDSRYDPRNDSRYDPRNDTRTDPRYDPRNDPRGGDNRDHDVYGDRGRGDYDHNRRDAGVLRWSGVVDGVTDIRIQGRRVEMISPRGVPAWNVRYDMQGASMPRHDVSLDLVNRAGRGTIRVVQQPSPRNGYVAVIRIEDGRAGAGAYNFDLRW
jgi:hypothetical protein